jgi:hypothetical protein
MILKNFSFFKSNLKVAGFCEHGIDNLPQIYKDNAFINKKISSPILRNLSLCK